MPASVRVGMQTARRRSAHMRSRSWDDGILPPSHALDTTYDSSVMSTMDGSRDEGFRCVWCWPCPIAPITIAAASGLMHTGTLSRRPADCHLSSQPTCLKRSLDALAGTWSLYVCMRGIDLHGVPTTTCWRECLPCRCCSRWQQGLRDHHNASKSLQHCC